MRKPWLIGSVLAATVIIGGGFALVSKQGAARAESNSKKEVPLEFTAAELARPSLAPMPVTIEFSGALVAPQTAVVRAKATGTLLSLDVAEGSRVKAGQRLGTIDLAELAARMAERNAQLESARAQLAQAERNHESNQRLAAQQFISPNALESSRVALESARAQMRAAQAQLDTTRVNLRDGALVAPISGLVAKRYVVAGEKLSPEQQVLSIVDLSRLEMAGNVGAHEVSLLSPGMPVNVKVEGVDTPVQGRITRIAPAAEPGTRSIGVTVEIANPKEVFRAGQYALASVKLADDKPRLTLPITAVGSVAGQDHVWTIEHGTLAHRAITTGRRDPACPCAPAPLPARK